MGASTAHLFQTAGLHVDFVGICNLDVLADLFDLVLDHEHIIARQELFALAIKNVDLLKQDYFRRHVCHFFSISI